MFVEKLRENAPDIHENPHALTRIGLKVAAYMAAFGFALMSLYSAAMYPSNESLPMMTKFSGISLIFFLAYKSLSG